MAKPQYIVQPFVGKNGKLKPGKPVAAGSAGACPVGTRVLARFGALPDNFDDNVGA